MITKSFLITSSAFITERIPSRSTLASSGAISIKDLREERDFSKDRPSRNAPNRNKKVTAADSVYSPIINAPITAIVTRSSILNNFISVAFQAFIKVG